MRRLKNILFGLLVWALAFAIAWGMWWLTGNPWPVVAAGVLFGLAAIAGKFYSIFRRL